MKKIEKQLKQMDFLTYFKKIKGWEILTKAANLICGYPYTNAVEIKQNLSVDVAATDGIKIYINPLNPMCNSIENGDKAKKSLCLMGLSAHESGHIRFSDFKALKRLCDSLDNGEFPEELKDKDFISKKDSSYYNELKVLIKTSPYSRNIVKTVMQFIDNIIDDHADYKRNQYYEWNNQILN